MISTYITTALPVEKLEKGTTSVLLAVQFVCFDSRFLKSRRVKLLIENDIREKVRSLKSEEESELLGDTEHGEVMFWGFPTRIRILSLDFLPIPSETF